MLLVVAALLLSSTICDAFVVAPHRQQRPLVLLTPRLQPTWRTALSTARQRPFIRLEQERSSSSSSSSSSDTDKELESLAAASDSFTNATKVSIAPPTEADTSVTKGKGSKFGKLKVNGDNKFDDYDSDETAAALASGNKAPPSFFSSSSSSTNRKSAAADDDDNNNKSSATTTTTQSTTTTTLAKFQRAARIFCNLFPVWTVLTAGSALYKPTLYTETLNLTPYFTQLIGLLMLCMGITLKVSDFQRVSQRPGAVGLAFVGCYGVLPALALGLGKALSLGPSLSAGLVLVACINGAQASNLCTYIGQGDLALSVLMTTMTTLGAIGLTPLMAKVLLGAVIPVNAAAVAWSTVQVVLVPILLGMSLNAKFPRAVQQILPFSPIVGVLVTCILVGSAVAGCASTILQAGWRLQLGGFLLHALGGLAGYIFTKPFYSEDVCRTFAIEFAMKSSAFGYLLASLHFTDFAVRVPSAVSIVWMTLIGSTLAVASRFFPPKECQVSVSAV